MEMNEINPQAQPGQNTQPEQPQPTLVLNQSQPQQPPLYDPGFAARMTDLIRDVFDPAYILLFGSMASGTPHSDTLCYDLLIATHDTPQYNWLAVKRYLKTKIPKIGHGAPYLNVYLHPVDLVASQFSPLFYLARAEGVLLYCSDRHNFRRPRKTAMFSQAACDAKQYYSTFMALGAEFLEQANIALTENKIRQSAFCAAQAAVYCYRVLFRVYHGFDFDTHDIMILHERMRTLSAELLLVLESDSYDPIYTLPCLQRFIVKARYDPSFFIHVSELERHLDRVKRMREIVEKLCMRRIALYKKLDAEQAACL